MTNNFTSGFAALPQCPPAERKRLQDREMHYIIKGWDGHHWTTRKGWKVVGDGFQHPEKGSVTRCDHSTDWIARDLEGRVLCDSFFPNNCFMACHYKD